MPNIMNTSQSTYIMASSLHSDSANPAIVRKPITSTLRSLNVGGVATFPIEQRTSVLIVANRIKKELVRLGWDYLSEDSEEEFTISITRIK